MVNFNKKRAGLHKRRAVSTIVGGAIFLVLFASASSTFFIAMDVQRDTINTQRVISDSIMEKSKEKFSIAVSTNEIDNNRLGIQVKNQGTNPVEIGNIWIINNSGSFPAKKYLIDYKDSVIPPGYGSNILENTPLFMNTDDYDIKVVSTFGTIAKSELNVGASNNMRATLIAIPPEVKVGQNVTLTMHVENIGNTRLLDVIPNGDYPNTVPPFTSPIPPVPIPVNLDPGEGVFFTWKYKATGSAGTIVNFDSYATATLEDMGYPVNSNVATESIQLREPDETEVIVLTEDLISRPEIFMVIPGPFGDGPENAIWGTNIVNPTGQDMYVSKVVLSLVSPRANSLDRMWSASAGSEYCNPQAIPPTPNGWSCPQNNELVWKSIASPIKIPPFSTYPFLARVHSDRLSGSFDTLEAVIVTGTVFTTVGEFSKSGYTSSIDNGGNSYVNVYLSNVPHSTNDADIKTNQTVGSGLTQEFNVVLADFEIGGTQITSDSRLIINIPKGWTVDQASITDFGDFIWNYQSFTDTSSQIVATLSAPLTDGGRTIQFDATAPTVSNEQMYIMYVLADGTTSDNAFSLGPLSEVVLRVTP